jgi:hypothetical protein
MLGRMVSSKTFSHFSLFLGLKIEKSINVKTNISNNGKLIINEGLV